MNQEWKERLQACAIGLPVCVAIQYTYDHGGWVSSTGCAVVIVTLCTIVILAVKRRECDQQDDYIAKRRECARRYLERAP